MFNISFNNFLLLKTSFYIAPINEGDTKKTKTFYFVKIYTFEQSAAHGWTRNVRIALSLEIVTANFKF